MMALRRQSRTVFLLILAVQLATSFGAIALLSRMGPAIANVAEENVESLSAVEQMLGALATPPSEDDEAPKAFLAAYARADKNVTEDEERPLLQAIRTDAEQALEGEPAARHRVLRALTELADINRKALRRADEDAQRLARAGAWAAVMLALIAFLLVQFMARRADRVFVMPILEIANVVNVARQGDLFRRCSIHSESPEIQSLADGVNRLLDRRKAPDPSSSPFDDDAL
ncbi:MAG: hypothetical protein GC160_06205 [Acidobacteria bacterium]|nr:hypothetical protein [Acidobacteriota bacterium]